MISFFVGSGNRRRGFGGCSAGGFSRNQRSRRIVPSSTPSYRAIERFDLPALTPSATFWQRSGIDMVLVPRPLIGHTASEADGGQFLFEQGSHLRWVGYGCLREAIG